MSSNRVDIHPCRPLFLAVISSILLAAGCARSSSSLAREAKIGRSEAEKIALVRVPDGKIVEGELEEEDGRLIWSFDISRPGAEDITEVHVDAKTGEIVRVETETPHQQKEEKEEKEEKDDD